MSGETIRVTITSDGIEVDASGFKGKTCLDELKKLQDTLASGGIDVKIVDQKMKGDMYANPVKAGVQKNER
jgi:hypothetical protein